MVRALAEDSKRSFWAMADQGAVSLGNFGLNIMLARHFELIGDLGSYGAFWVLMELMYFLNGIQSAILIYPLTVWGVALDRDELGRLTSRSLTLTLMAGPLLLLIMIATAMVAHVGLAVGIWAGAALVAWQLQELTRRALMAHLKFRAAFIGDAIGYLGQFAVIAGFSLWSTLDLQRTFQVITLTLVIACLVQAIQLGLRRTEWHDIFAFARRCWGTGKWILYGNMTNVFSGALFNWNFAYWAGLERVGIYYGLINMTRPAHPLAFAVVTLITPTAAKALKTEGMGRAKRSALRFTLLGALMLAPYLGVLILFPTLSLNLVYHENSAYAPYKFLVQVSVVAVALVYVGMAAGAFLNGVERVRESFVGQVVYAAAYLLVVLPATARFGLHGAIIGWLVAAVLRAVVNGYFAIRARDPQSDPAVSHPQGISAAPALGPPVS